MIRYKTEGRALLEELKLAGYNTNKLRQEKILAESTIQKLRENIPVSIDNLDTLCRLLHRQPGDIIEYVDESQPQPERRE